MTREPAPIWGGWWFWEPPLGREPKPDWGRLREKASTELAVSLAYLAALKDTKP